MSDIRVDISSVLSEGLEVLFYAPCDCSEVTGLKVYYTDPITLEETCTPFTFCDAKGNDLGNLDNLFAKDACVKVILSVVESRAYIQNAVTNSYLEEKFEKLDAKIAVSDTAPEVTSGLWADTSSSEGVILKYYDTTSKTWVAVKATWG